MSSLIKKLLKHIESGAKPKVIDTYEERIAEDFDVFVDDESFYKIPFDNIMSVVKKYSESDDADVGVYRKLVNNISSKKEAPLIFNVIKMPEGSDLKAYTILLSELNSGPFFSKFHELVEDDKNAPERDYLFELSEKDRKISELESEVSSIKESYKRMMVESTPSVNTVKKINTSFSKPSNRTPHELSLLATIVPSLSRRKPQRKQQPKEPEEEEKKEETSQKSDGDDNDAGSIFVKNIENDNVEFVKRIIKNSPLLVNEPLNKGISLMHFASLCGSIKILKLLVSEGAIVDIRDDDDDTPLILAAYSGKTECAKYLISAGADIEAKDNKGCTPLYLAAQNGHADTIRVLLDNHADQNVVVENGRNPLMSALFNEKEDAARLLIQRGSNKETTPNGKSIIFNCAIRGLHKMVRLLVECGVPVDYRCQDGTTSLMGAACEGELETVKVLISLHASINAVDEDGESALFTACINNKLDVVKYLIDNGAKIELASNAKRTALHAAIIKGNYDVVKYLVSKNANIEAETKIGDTPFTLACYCGNVDIVKFLVSKKINRSQKDEKGNTGFIQAVSKNNVDVVKYLISAGFDPNECANYKTSALHIAVINDNLEMAKALVSGGADTKAKRVDGKRPLDLAKSQLMKDFLTLC